MEERKRPSTSSENGLLNGEETVPSKLFKPCGSKDQTDPPLDWQSTKSVVAERFGYICNLEKYADVHLLVGPKEHKRRIPTHKLVLAVGSVVFDAMFSEKWANSKDVDIPDIEPDIFLALLKFLYSDVIELTIENVMDVLYAAKKYAVCALEKLCLIFLRENLNASNVFIILPQAKLLDESKVITSCLRIIDDETKNAVETDSFTSIDVNTLTSILERNTLRIEEYDLLRATLRWSEAELNRNELAINSENRLAVLRDVVYLLRYPLLSLAEFSSGVAETELLSDRDLVSMFMYFANQQTPPPDCFNATPRVCPYFVVNRFPPSTDFRYYRTHQWNSSQRNYLGFSCHRDLYLMGIGLFGSLGRNGTYDVECSIGEDINISQIVSKSFKSVNSSGKIVRLMLDSPLKLIYNRIYYIRYFVKGSSGVVGYGDTPRDVTVELPGTEGQNVKVYFIEEEGQKVPEILLSL